MFNAKKSKCVYTPPYKCKALEPGIREIFCIGGQAVEYVSQWLHLGHIVSDGCDDKADIVNRRNILCGQINNVLCYFGKCQSAVKQKLPFAYCYSLYGSVLWDLNNPCICTRPTLCKGLRRAWGLLCSATCIE